MATKFKDLTQEEKNAKYLFWTRLVLFCFFSLAPILFMMWRFDLFGEVSAMSIGGWGIIAFLIVFVFLIIMFNYVIKSRKWSYWKQILKGIAFLILPLFFVLICLNAAQGYITQLMQLICCCILCWSVAIAINPMPEWAFKQSQGEQESFMNYVLDKREAKKNNEKK